jgi:hypothetical protein
LRVTNVEACEVCEFSFNSKRPVIRPNAIPEHNPGLLSTSISNKHGNTSSWVEVKVDYMVVPPESQLLKLQIRNPCYEVAGILLPGFHGVGFLSICPGALHA